MFETNILKFFFLERASTSNFCYATKQNNPHIILNYVSYDRLDLLQPCGKFLSWAPPVPLGNFYSLAPPPPRNFHWPSMGGQGGMDIFWNLTFSKPAALDIIVRGSNYLIALQYRPKQQQILAACIYKLWICFVCLESVWNEHWWHQIHWSVFIALQLIKSLPKITFLAVCILKFAFQPLWHLDLRKVFGISKFNQRLRQLFAHSLFW